MPDSPRVLVVDDNFDSAQSLRMLFTLSNCQVQVAYDGLTAVDLAAEFLPDLVILDLGLPKLDGVEVCRRIRRLPQGDQMTIVAVTGWSDDEDEARTRDAGFSCHLVKPVDLARLQAFLPCEHSVAR